MKTQEQVLTKHHEEFVNLFEVQMKIAGFYSAPNLKFGYLWSKEAHQDLGIY